jgi:hypothetical protein
VERKIYQYIFLLFLVLLRRNVRTVHCVVYLQWNVFIYLPSVHFFGYGLIPQQLRFGQRNTVGDNNHRGRNLCLKGAIFYYCCKWKEGRKNISGRNEKSEGDMLKENHGNSMYAYQMSWGEAEHRHRDLCRWHQNSGI